METAITIAVIVAVLGGVIGYFAWTRHQRKKRIEGFESFGAPHGLSLRIDPDYDLPKDNPSLDLFQDGDKRYAYNVLTGTCMGLPVTVSDYHYQTTRRMRSEDSEGNVRYRNQTSHFRSSFAMVEFPERFPAEMRIRPEGWLDKVADAVGFSEVEVGDENFDKAWLIKTKDAKLALDFLTEDMRTHIDSHRALKPTFEFDSNTLLIQRADKRFKLEELPTIWHLLEGIIERSGAGKADPAPAAPESVDASDTDAPADAASASDGESEQA